MEIYNFLEKHNGISFHMPAHKNRAEFVYNDLTEIYGADNLRSPRGIIESSQRRAAEILGGKKAFYLVNGASSGMISAVASLGEREIFIDRGCHESAINGLIISGGIPKYIYPKTNEIFGIPEPIAPVVGEIKNAFVYTAVTYYGKVCNSKKIRENAGDNAILIADEAHGAHFYFSEMLKKYRATQADINVLSFHKSLPSLTQTAVLLTKDDKANSDFLEKCKNLITTTSPSYPLMASLDYAFSQGERVYEKSIDISAIKEKIEKNSDIHIYESDDPWKLLLNFKNCDSSANSVDKGLREKYNIYSEGIFGDNILFMLSPYNSDSEIETLTEAVCKSSRMKESEKQPILDIPIIKLETAITPREAFFAKGEIIDVKASKGRISKENITFFPPCVPVVAIGERISEEAAYFLAKSKKHVEVVK